MRYEMGPLFLGAAVAAGVFLAWILVSRYLPHLATFVWGNEVGILTALILGGFVVLWLEVRRHG